MSIDSSLSRQLVSFQASKDTANYRWYKYKEAFSPTWECARLLIPGGYFFMVNDNVRYNGVNVSADLILSDMAQQMGFQVRQILTLPIAKGNSSQQMGEHGRDPLRKCVYVWQKA